MCWKVFSQSGLHVDFASRPNDSVPLKSLRKIAHSVFDCVDHGVQAHSGSRANPNQQTASNKVISFQPQEKLFKKYSSKINVDQFKLSDSSNEDRLRVRDKKDRATAEQVMDPRTRMILFKLMNRGFITQINGCISTGKEANVYHATGKDDTQLALKIYKTSILVFKDRDKYVTGEFR